MFNKTYTMGGVPATEGRSFSAMTRDAISGSMAFLESELEKLDPTLHEPLTSTTYARDIDIDVGGGWVDRSSAFFVDFGAAGGSGVAGVGNGADNVKRIIQANLSKDIYPIYPYQAVMQIKFIDLQRGNVTGRSLEQIYDDGIRMDFDKHMDLNTYIGFEELGTYGLVNNPKVTATTAAATGTSSGTKWTSKTPDQILADINTAITSAWEAAGYDNSAIPNHILIDPQNYAYLVSQKVSDAGNVSILEFLLQNNIARNKGVDLFIGECKFCAGAGTSSANRMVVYRRDRRFLSMDLAQPLSRVMTNPNTNNATYDSLYMANVGIPKVKYTQPILYVDGI